MSAYDIVQAILQYYDNDMKEAIEVVNDLIAEIDGNSRQLVHNLSNELEEKALSTGLCPLCGNKIIELESHEEDRGEYFGRPVTEKEAIYGCESCNYIEN